MSVSNINNLAISLRGSFFRTVKVRDEPYDCISDVPAFINSLKQSKVGADLFTFSQPISEVAQKHDYFLERDSYSVLTIGSFENWWKKQINDKTRNMIRKAKKKGVEIRAAEFDDKLVEGIKDIYDESPIIQGKPNRHYGKSLQAMRDVHSTFMERSEFFGAYFEDKLVGFVKLVHSPDVASLMSIISKVEHRDKAPTNALLARAVEICAERGIPYLHYGLWSRRGIGEFKKHHAFERRDVPRYFVPLNAKGKLMLRLRLHRKISDRLPEKWLVTMANLRDKWNTYRFSTPQGLTGR